MPPTVAKRPESGPKYGVRTPSALVARYSSSQVTPTSATTKLSSAAISTFFRRVVSIRTAAAEAGSKPCVYEMPPPRGTTGRPASWATRTTAASSSALPGRTTVSATSSGSWLRSHE